MKIEYTPKGVCSRRITVEVSDDEKHIVENISFEGGCAGNTSGISKLAVGRPAEEIIKLLENVKCPGRISSCPAQLSVALEKAVTKS